MSRLARFAAIFGDLGVEAGWMGRATSSRLGLGRLVM